MSETLKLTGRFSDPESDEKPEDVTVEAGYPLVTDEDVKEMLLAILAENMPEEIVNMMYLTDETYSDSDQWFTIRLSNGAEWQVQIGRRGWPEDGTSTQWDS